MQIYSQGRGSLEGLSHSTSGVHRSQAFTKARRREPKPCIPVKAASTSIAWAPEASKALETNSNTPASLADVADELLGSERRKREDETYSPGAKRLQEQPALQLEKALRAHDGVHTLSSAQLQALKGLQTHASNPTQGRPAWNKGRKMSEATRQKISITQKKRWTEAPVRAARMSKLKGRVPWNKGKKLSLETRLRMSLAKQRSMRPKATKRKEAVAKQSAALTGVPKTQEHKDAIAAAHRRRQTAASILRAVEDVHSQQQASSPASAAGRSVPGSRASASGRQLESTVMGSYKAELREFRALQEELEPWTQAFREQHNCKPTLADVQATRIPWLINKYKQYVLMRERLLNDTQKLRTKLQNSIPEPRSSERNIRSFQERMNANSSRGANSKDAAARMFSALEYKRTSGAAAGRAQAANSMASCIEDPSAKSAAVSAGGLNGSELQDQEQTAGDPAREAAGSDDLSEKLSRLSPSAPPRVASAMSAAMQYRKLKAAKTAAAARAAADAAAAAAAAAGIGQGPSTAANRASAALGSEPAAPSTSRSSPPGCQAGGEDATASAAHSNGAGAADARRGLPWQ